MAMSADPNEDGLVPVKTKLQLEHKIFVVSQFYENNKNWAIVRDAFVHKYAFYVPSDDQTFAQIIRNFEKTGSVRPTTFCDLVPLLEPKVIVEDGEESLNICLEQDVARDVAAEGPTQSTEQESYYYREIGTSLCSEEQRPGINSAGNGTEVGAERCTERKTKYDRKTESKKQPIVESVTPVTVHKSRMSLNRSGDIDWNDSIHKQSKKKKKYYKANHFECSICDKILTTKESQQSHEKTHLPRKDRDRFVCPKCPRSFFQKRRMLLHLRRHSVEPELVCEWCGEKFHTQNLLSRHIFLHTRPFQCKHCGTKFSALASMNAHIRRIHTGEKPFKCSECDKAFADSRSLAIHNRIHTGENPFVCHLCGKTTNQHQNMKSHLKHAHKIANPRLGPENNAKKAHINS